MTERSDQSSTAIQAHKAFVTSNMDGTVRVELVTDDQPPLRMFIDLPEPGITGGLDIGWNDGGHCECFTCRSCPHPEPHYCNACTPDQNGSDSAGGSR